MRLGMISRMHSRSRLTRVIRHCVLLALISFILTVSTSWLCAWAAPAPVTAAGIGYPAGQPWSLPVPSSWPPSPKSGTYQTTNSLYITTSGMKLPPPSIRYQFTEGLHNGVSGSRTTGWNYLNGDPRYVIDLYRMGWPMRTMTHRGALDTRPLPKYSRAHFLYHGIQLPEISWLGLKPNRSLPFMPLWKPFLLSLLIYSFLIESLLQLYLTRTRFRRRKWRLNGGCLICGYVLEGLATCPECGAEACGDAGSSDE